MPNQAIHVGTSGWNYPHWRQNFYPEELPQNKWLEYYTAKLATVEINNSFYQLPEAKTLQGWHETAPAGFCFAVKASRYITHMKKLKEPRESFQKFLQRIEILGEHLGPILFQLPPRWHCNPDRLLAFLELLPRHFRYTFEFRDATWFEERVFQALRDHNAAFCIYDLKGEQSPKEVTADFVYVRLHGPARQAYSGSYDTESLAGWAGAFSTWRRQGKEIFCYFDNDEKGYAAHDAVRLQEMLQSE